MNDSQYLKTFFEEKAVPFKSWEIEDQNGTPHMIDNEVVIEMIHSAPATEKKQIAKTIREIDFRNGDVNHFLKFLAGALVDGYCK